MLLVIDSLGIILSSYIYPEGNKKFSALKQLFSALKHTKSA